MITPREILVKLGNSLSRYPSERPINFYTTSQALSDLSKWVDGKEMKDPQNAPFPLNPFIYVRGYNDAIKELSRSSQN